MSKKTRIFTIEIHCKGCGQHLYTYRKEGPGHLVKCFVDGITADSTTGNLQCPSCQTLFARLASYHNRPAHKIIQGKVEVRGHVKH